MPATRAEFASAQSRAYEIAIGLRFAGGDRLRAAGRADCARPVRARRIRRPAIRRQSQPRWRRFVLGSRDTCSRRYSARFHSRTRTRIRPCLPPLPVSPRPSSAACCCFHGLGTSASRRRLPMSGWVGAGLLGALLIRRRWLRIDRRRPASPAARLPRHDRNGRRGRLRQSCDWRGSVRHRSHDWRSLPHWSRSASPSTSPRCDCSAS